jgi:iron complex transport system permease protein
LAAVALVYVTAGAVRGHDPLLVLVLAGVVVGSLLAVDTLARTIARIEIPLGVLTAFVGTPLFLWQLVVARRAWQ